MRTRHVSTLAPLLLLLGTSLALASCTKSKEPTVALSGDSPAVVAGGIRTRIEQTVEDTQRRDALLEDMDEIDMMLAEMARTVVESLDTLATADADRQKRKDDFLTTHAAIRQVRNDGLRQYVDIRLQMRELLTEDEWNRISAGVPR